MTDKLLREGSHSLHTALVFLNDLHPKKYTYSTPNRKGEKPYRYAYQVGTQNYHGERKNYPWENLNFHGDISYGS